MTGGIELGGTTTVVAVRANNGSRVLSNCFQTDTPEMTVGMAAATLRTAHLTGPITRLGVAAFGPVGINPEHPSHGRLLTTPKPGWSGFDLLGALRKEFGDIPIALDTDVNAAALAEHKEGAGQGCDNLAYITIGTGIGAGIIAEGKLLKGALHPEFGHLKVPRHPEDDFAGVCPAHGDCLEGLAGGPALAQRWDKRPEELSGTHPAWEMEAWYLAHGVLALLAIACPSRIIIGGGVSQAEGFHARVEGKLRELAAGYFTSLNENTPFVVPPGLGQEAGVVGAMLLATTA